MDPFYLRHTKFLIASAVGGFYVDGLENIIKNKIILQLIVLYNVLSFAGVCVSFFSSISHLYIKATQVSEYFFDLQAICTNILVSFNVLYLTLLRRKYFAVLTNWDRIFVGDEDNKERQKYMDDEVGKMMKVMKISSFLLSSLPLWMITQFFIEDKTIKFPVPYDYKHQSPDFELIIGWHLFAFTMFSTNTVIINVLQMLPLCWEVSEIRRLKQKLSDTIDEYDANNDPTSSKITRQLKTWVIQHQKLCSFHNDVGKIYVPQLSVQIFSTMMTAWMLAYVIAAEIYPVEDVVASFFFYLPQYLIFFTASKVGNKLKEESDSLFGIAVDKKWHHLPNSLQRSLFLICLRSTKPLVFKGFYLFPLGYDTFFQIFKTSYTVLNFIKAAF